MRQIRAVVKMVQKATCYLRFLILNMIFKNLKNSFEFVPTIVIYNYIDFIDQACQTGGPIACTTWPAVTFYDPRIIETIIKWRFFNGLCSINQYETFKDVYLLNTIQWNQSADTYFGFYNSKCGPQSVWSLIYLTYVDRQSR